MAINQSTGSGWKDSSYTLTDTGDQLFEGLEKNGYFLEDIIISKENHKFHPIYNRQGKIVELYAVQKKCKSPIAPRRVNPNLTSDRCPMQFLDNFMVKR